jgi:hypothetical protein
MGILSLLGHQLAITPCASNDLATLSHFQFDIVNQRARRDVPERQGIARFNVSRRACDHLFAQLKLRGCEDIPFLPIRIVKQGDPRGSIRVIFNGSYSGGYLSFVPFEVDDSILFLVGSPFMPSRDSAVGVPSSALLEREKKALLRGK